MKATLKEYIQETPLVRTLVFEMDEEMVYEPGQFMSFIFTCEEDGKEKVMRRSYSISHWQKQPTKSFTTTLNEVPQGKCSGMLYNATVGTTFEITGPHGVFKLKESTKPHVFVAAGTGITPLMTMVEFLKDSGKDISVVYSVKSLDNMIFRDDLQTLESTSKINFIPLLTRETPEGWTGKIGRISQDILAEMEPATKEWYICGMLEFVKATEQYLETLDVPKEQIHVEKW